MGSCDGCRTPPMHARPSPRSPRKGKRVATAATKDLNATVYEQVGLAEPRRSQLIGLLADLRATGGEFDVERSDQVIEALGARHPRKGRRGGPAEVA